MKFWTRVLVGISVVALLVLLLLALLHTPPARRYVLAAAAQYLRDGQGIELKAARLDYNLFRLAVWLQDASLRSTAAPDLPPFLSLRSAYLNLGLLRLLSGVPAVEEARLEQVAFQLAIDEKGRDNLPVSPQAQPEPPPADVLPAFLISSFGLADGSILVDDRQHDLRLEVPLFRLTVRGDSEKLQHALLLETTRPGSVVYERRTLPLDGLRLEALLTRSSLELKRLRLDAAGSWIGVAGTLKGFARRELDFQVETSLEAAPLGVFAGLRERAGGNLAARLSISGTPEALQAAAKVDGRRLFFRNFRDISLSASAAWDGSAEQLCLESLDLRSPMGAVRSQAALALAKGGGRSRLKAALSRLDLDRATRLLGLPVQVASLASVSVDANWNGLEFDKARGAAALRLSATRPEPAVDVVPLSASIDATASHGDISLELASLEAFGSLWQGHVSLASFKRLDGELRANVPSLARLIAQLETFLGKEPGSLAGTPLDGSVQLAAGLGGAIDGPELTAALGARDVRAGQLRDIQLTAQAAVFPDRVLLDDLNLSWQDQSLSARGEVAMLKAGPSFNLDARLAHASLAAILGGLDVELPAAGTLGLEARLRGTAEDPAAEISFSASELAAYGETIGNLNLRARLAERKLHLDAFHLEKPLPGGTPGSWTAAGSYDLDAGAYWFETEARDLVFSSLTLPGELPVRGALSLLASGAGSASNPSLKLALDLRELSLRDQLFGAVNVLAGLANRQAALDLRLPRFNVASNLELATQAPYPAKVAISATKTDLAQLGVMLAENEPLQGAVTLNLNGSGELENWKQARASALIDDLLVLVRGQQIRNGAPMRLGFSGGALQVETAELVTGDSRFSLTGALPLDASAPSGALTAKGDFDLPGLLALLPSRPDFALTGKLALDASVRGSLEKPDPTARLTLKDASLSREEMKVSVPLVDLNVQPSGEGARFTLGASGLRLEAPKMSAALGLRVEGETPQIQDLAALRAKAVFNELLFKAGVYEVRQQVPSTISLAGGLARVEQFLLAGPKTRLELVGEAEIAPGQSLDLRLAGDLDAEVLALFAEGLQVSGETQFVLALSGELPAPQLSGYLELKEGQAGISAPRLAAENLDLRLYLSPESITVERFTGLLNGGSLKAGGSVRYSKAGLENLDLNFSLDAAFLNLPEGLKSQVAADLRLRSQKEFIVLGGNVRIQESSYRDPLELESQVLAYLRAEKGVDLAAERSPFLSNLRFNIAVDTVGPILINNNLAKLAIQSNLRVVGTYYRPALTGRIVLEEGGQIYLSEREYFVERGVVSFVNETRIEPDLDILARIKVASYDITLQISGGAEDISATFTSDPSLSQPDIFSVLLTGRTLDQIQGAQLNVAKEQALSYVTGRAAGRVSRGAQERLVLSQVRIEPNLIAAESNPGARLTLGQDITDFLRLIYSMNLADSRDQIYIAEYDLTRRFVSRAIRQSDNSYRFEFRHDVRMGGAPDTGRLAPAPERVERRIGEITLQGDLTFPENVLLSKLKLEPGDKYDFFKVQDGIDRLEKYYEQQRHLEARIRVQRQAAGDRMNLVFNIDAGPEVGFSYEGAGLPGKVRDSVQRIWKDGILDVQRLEESVRAIRAALVEQGHFQAKVDHRVEQPTDGLKQVAFTVDPGPKFKNVELVFEGAAGVEPSRLRQLIKDAGLGTEIYTEPGKITSLLEAWYASEGFLEARLRQPRYELDSQAATGRVVFPVEEGPHFKVGTLTFQGNDSFDDSRLLTEMPLGSGSPYRAELLETSLSRLEEFYWRGGYNDVVVNYAFRRRPEEGLIDLDFRITENKREIVQEIRVEGNHETNEKFVRGQVTLEEGEVLDFTRTNRSRKNLYDTGAYALVDIQAQPLELPAGTPQLNTAPMAVNVKLREVKPFEIRYGAFFDTDRGPGFIADFANRNSLGSARVLGVRTRYDSDIRELRGYLSQPLLRRFPLKSNLIGFVRREIFDTFITDRTGFSVQQEAHFGLKTILSYGYRFERTDTFDKDPESLFKVPPFNIAPLTATYTRETRDDFLDAARGSFFSHAFEYAPSAFGSDLRFVKYFGQYFKYIPLSESAEVPFGGGLRRPRWIYAGGLRLGLAKGLGGQDLIRTERFFAGGGTTLRGFEQNTLGPLDFFGEYSGGDAVFLTNNELRFPVFSVFEGVGFLDMGNVYRRIGDFDLFDVRKSAGLGLRVRTPYFLLRLDYGFKLGLKPGESRGALFFSIGQAF